VKRGYLSGDRHFDPVLNDYLVKISNRNLVRMYFDEIHDYSLKGGSSKLYFPDGPRRKLMGLGVLKIRYGRRTDNKVIVDWVRVWDILG
jgi:hypothetical protein